MPIRYKISCKQRHERWANLRKGNDDFPWPFYLYHTKFAQYIYNKTDSYISSSCFSRYLYVPETLMQKSNMGIIGNDVRIKWE